MTGLWLALGLIFGAVGIVFNNGPEVIAAAFCILMALVSAVIRDHGVNRNASAQLNSLDRHRVGYEDERRAA